MTDMGGKKDDFALRTESVSAKHITLDRHTFSVQGYPTRITEDPLVAVEAAADTRTDQVDFSIRHKPIRQVD